MKLALEIWGRKIGFELRSATSGLANPSQWLIDALDGGSTYAGVSVTEQTALRMSAVWGCVRILSESMASLPLILYRRDGDGKSRATDHPLYSILHDMPNPEMTAYTFRVVMMAGLCLLGNAYAEIERDRLGRVIALWPVPLDQYTVTQVRESGAILYKLRKSADGTEIRMPAERMYHVMGLSTNGYEGLAPIEAYRQAVGIGLAAEEYGARFFGNGANLGGVLEHPGTLKEDAAKRLRESWESRHGGVSKSHKTAILEEGMKYVAIGIPPKDAAFLESRQFQVTDIARIFRVPPHMLQQLDRATWANIEHQSIEFVTHTLGPWMENWEQTISWKLLSAQERQEYFAEFLAEGFLRGDTQSRYQAHAVGRQWGWLSANDIRRMENMDPLPEGGDIYLVPLNMVPSDQAGSRPPAPTDGLGGPSSTRSAERRAQGGGPERRMELAEVYAPIFRDVFLRIFRREKADVLRAARKATMTADALAEWIEEYYREHPEFGARTILPALESYADAVGRTTTEETGQAWEGLPDELRVFLAEYSNTFGIRESISSRMRADAAIREASAANEPAADHLERMFDEWEADRAEDDTQWETVQASNAVCRTVFALAGVTVLRWRANPDACPLCQSMDGRASQITSTFLADGQIVDGDEETTPLTVERDLGHPPLHRGCGCQITAG